MTIIINDNEYKSSDHPIRIEFNDHAELKRMADVLISTPEPNHNFISFNHETDKEWVIREKKKAFAKDNPITFCLTSSGRIDLLTQTLESFFKLNTYPIAKFIINEDCGDQWKITEVSQRIYDIFNRFGHRVQIIGSPEKRGQSASIDAMYALVETEYIFHSEDDWRFEGNPNFIEDSIKILEARKDIHQVWIRHRFNHGHPVGQMEQVSGVYCSELERNFLGGWSGFTWNPGVRRLSDYKRMFPEGFNALCKDGNGTEKECSEHANRFDYKAIALMDGACLHIGADHHTENYKW